MPASRRRRSRSHDPLASPVAVRCLLDDLRRQCPTVAPANEKQLILLLESVRHEMRRPQVDNQRGRPRRHSREMVLVVGEKLKKILQQKTGGRVSVSSFISQYVRMLKFPSDVTRALTKGEINLQEAAYLARLTPARLQSESAQARLLRQQIMQAHIKSGGSQNSLRQRVKAVLGEITEVNFSKRRTGRKKADELLQANPYDARLLFYEEIEHLTTTLGEIEPEELNGPSVGEVLKQVYKVMNMLRRLKQRKGQNQPAKVKRRLRSSK